MRLALDAIPPFVPASGLELPGSAEPQTVKRGGLILLLKGCRAGMVPANSDVKSLIPQQIGPNRSVVPDPAESFPDQRI